MTKLLLIAAVVIWGWTFVATKICLAYLLPMEIIAGRFLIGLPILYFLLRRLNISLHAFARDRVLLMATAAVVCVHFLIQVVALQYTSASKTGWMISITPLVTAALSAWWLEERLVVVQWLGILLATVGVLLLISNGEFSSLAGFSNIGDWLILASAHTWAIYSIMSRRLIPERQPLATTFLVFLPLFAVALTGSVLLRAGAFDRILPAAAGITAMPIRGWIALLFLGVLGTLAQWFWQTGIARLGAARAGVYLYLEPVATTILAVPLLHEPLGAMLVVGAGLILAGVWVAERKGAEKK